jgi:hypothetical protein
MGSQSRINQLKLMNSLGGIGQDRGNCDATVAVEIDVTAVESIVVIRPRLLRQVINGAWLARSMPTVVSARPMPCAWLLELQA